LVDSIELSAVLHPHEISSPTLRDEQVPGICEDRVLRGEWRKLFDEELHHLYPSPNITMRIRWVEHVALVEDKEKYIQSFGVEGRGKKTTWNVA